MLSNQCHFVMAVFHLSSKLLNRVDQFEYLHPNHSSIGNRKHLQLNRNHKEPTQRTQDSDKLFQLKNIVSKVAIGVKGKFLRFRKAVKCYAHQLRKLLTVTP